MRALIFSLLTLIPTLLLGMNGMSTLGFGVQSRGMGGVGVAFPQDSFASGHNPAGMAALGSRWDLGFGALWQEGRGCTREGDLNRCSSSHRPIPLPEAGMNWEFCPHQTVGIFVANYGGFATDYGGLEGGMENFPMLVVPSWSWRFCCQQAIGAALRISLNSIRVCGTQAPVVAGSIYPSDVTNRGWDFRQGMGFSIGWQAYFGCALTVGAAFHSEVWSDRFEKYQGYFVDEGQFNLAPSAALGMSWHFCPRALLAIDFVYHFWSAVPQLDHVVRQAGLTTVVFGSGDGAGFGWRNQGVFKLGLMWEPWDCLEFRLGYNYGPTPIVPTETALNQSTLATVEHHLTVGGSYRFCGFEWSGYYAAGFWQRVRGHFSLDPASAALEIDLSNCQQEAGFAVGRRY